MNYIYHKVPEFDKQFSKLTKKNKALKERFMDKIDQILIDPDIGEPKSYGLKGVRGVHVDPFVIAYMIISNCIVFLYVCIMMRYTERLMRSSGRIEQLSYWIK